MKIPIDQVIYRADLYPRAGYDENTVNSYALNLPELPPIIISENHILVDGRHRWMAFKIAQAEEIEVEIIPITEDIDILKEAIRRNSSHGKQLTIDEKKELSNRLYSTLGIKELIELLQVSQDSIYRWTKNLRQKEREAEKAEEAKMMEKAFDLWMACHSYDEISEQIGISKGKISDSFTETQKRIREQIGENPPESLKVFNLWQFQKSNDKLKYPGQIPSQIIENLLWYYTEPFDVVYDPFAGGGSTLRVCKQMDRRWQASDINPISDEIKKHDITTGFPDWIVKPNFIFLDPPYWDMKEGDYSDDETNLANMSLERFYESIDKLAKEAKKVLKDGGHIAWIISASQKDGVYYDHAIEFFKIFDKYFTPVIRIDCPYTTQIASGATVASAKKKKLILKQTRDIAVFKK
ncbi:hypothetical protein LCGC14_1318900 [marine sediment metagenome]|uniref:ParB-like N-terminal domain-containing protein n=1 Tax=marine sediment metagenome TaxID=412755 RepID=A0A0F9N0W8_9ZZZZ